MSLLLKARGCEVIFSFLQSEKTHRKMLFKIVPAKVALALLFFLLAVADGLVADDITHAYARCCDRASSMHQLDTPS
jgi:hypothetical protein